MSLPYQLEVNQTGAATYAIPVALPPGTASVVPNLSVFYSSQGRNGLLGVGWTLSGLSSIGRCSRTVAQDGVLGGVNFDANDRFCVDGGGSSWSAQAQAVPIPRNIAQSLIHSPKL